MIICSIDIIDGKAVQLQQGERVVVERDDVITLAERFGRLGDIAVVDIDGARGTGDNRALIERLCSVASVRVGGGIRDVENARRYLHAGAKCLVIGTAAEPEFLTQLPRKRVIVALDARGGYVTTHGWRSSTNESPYERARRLEPFCGGFLFTDVDREGLLGGIDMEKATALREATQRPLTVAGGIQSVAEIRELDACGIDAQVGMAIYQGRIDPIDAFISCVKFDGTTGLVPTVVCDARDGRTRMLAYSSARSLAIALGEGSGTFWSRSRQALWRKGDSSGNRQRLVRTSIDCDRDALIFYVAQVGATCHRGTDRCFDENSFDWVSLCDRIDERRSSGDARSYTRKLIAERGLLDAKLREEIEEVVTASDNENLAWECADVLYFLSVKMRANGLRIEDVMNRLAARAL